MDQLQSKVNAGLRLEPLKAGHNVGVLKAADQFRLLIQTLPGGTLPLKFRQLPFVDDLHGTSQPWHELFFAPLLGAQTQLYGAEGTTAQFLRDVPLPPHPAVGDQMPKIAIRCINSNFGQVCNFS